MQSKPEVDKQYRSLILPNLQGYIEKFANTQEPLKEERKLNYSLEHVVGRGWDHHFNTKSPLGDLHMFHICRDAYHTIYLKFKETPQALVSFGAYPNSSVVLVRQIQGIRAGIHAANTALPRQVEWRGSRYLAPLKWSELMLQTAIEFARLNSFKEIHVCNLYKAISASEMNESSPESSTKRRWRIYNQTPKALGFTQDSSGDWSLNLTKS